MRTMTKIITTLAVSAVTLALPVVPAAAGGGGGHGCAVPQRATGGFSLHDFAQDHQVTVRESISLQRFCGPGFRPFFERYLDGGNVAALIPRGTRIWPGEVPER